MNKIDRLTKLVSDADEAYKQSVIGVLDEIAPGLDMESRQKIAEIDTDIAVLMKSY